MTKIDKISSVPPVSRSRRYFFLTGQNRNLLSPSETVFSAHQIRPDQKQPSDPNSAKHDPHGYNRLSAGELSFFPFLPAPQTKAAGQPVKNQKQQKSNSRSQRI